MVCLRVYNSPVCGKAGETKGDGTAAVNSRCHCRRSSKRTVTCTSPPISYNCFRSITRSFIEPNSRFGSEYSWCFPCTCFCNQITAVAPENNFRNSYFTSCCNRTQSKQKSLHLIGAGNIDRKIPLLLLDILLQVIHQTDAVTAIRRPEFGPQGLCIVLAQRFESRLQPLGQFALVIKLVAGALEGIPHIPSIVAQIPVTDPIAPEPDLRTDSGIATMQAR